MMFQVYLPQLPLQLSKQTGKQVTAIRTVEHNKRLPRLIHCYDCNQDAMLDITELRLLHLWKK